MSKVKESGRKTVVRNAKVIKTAKKTATKVRSKLPAKKAKPGRASAKRTRSAVAPPAVRIDIKELDPLRKCGPGTSVQVLLRVIERIDGKSTSHLVFFDKYGWYCDHGPACPAVGYARKSMRRRARVGT